MSSKRKKARMYHKLESTEGTGCFYYVSKNSKNTPEKLELNKYDRVLRKRVKFKETKR